MLATLLIAGLALAAAPNTEPLLLSAAKGKAPLTVTIVSPKELVLRIKSCKYSVGFHGPSGNGLSLQWEPGSHQPKFDLGKKQGDSCASLLSHTYTKAGSHKVSAKLWHPGPNDAPVTEWQGEAAIEVSP